MNSLERSLALNCYVLKTTGTQFCRRKKLFIQAQRIASYIHGNSRTPSYL